MRQFNYLEALYGSFFSADLYRDVARRWQGTGLLYLLMLLALAWVPEMLHVHAAITRFVEQELPPLLAQLPALRIEKGRVSTDVETPYFIRDPKKDEVVAVIDLTGKFASLQDTDARVLLTETTLYYRNRPHETRVYDLSQIESFSLDRATVEDWVGVGKTWLAVLLYPFALLSSFIYRVVQALLYAVIGLVLAKGMKVALDYQALLRLACVAVTPVIVLDTLRSVADVPVSFWWPLAFVIAMGYLVFAVRANASSEQPVSPTATPPAYS